ncbi:MAG: hypothetical protein JXA57_10480 [Armatimonadetes bacterium]|nr:hypothetical protein [Armatimonadota bacterium]
MNLKALTSAQLLGLHSDVLAELRSRGVVRSSNSPVADYAELLVCRALKLQQASPSEKGFDAVAADGTRYEVKARRYSPTSHPSHFSAIRGLKQGHFDFLVCVLFEADFSVRQAVVLPIALVTQIAVFRKHVNGHLVTISGAVGHAAKGRDITASLRRVRAKL